ncbi:RING-H2 finger protein ATL46-like [Humulus lupulus]|uniref:RING-H2 finger protein ATL46-like n=1 Tax=Humulus lupulus TaxID=3486 RepID=UPI002B40FB1A|nr:RING-H2 finger protein ATL46-like [Humulus lupulus]
MSSSLTFARRNGNIVHPNPLLPPPPAPPFSIPSNSVNGQVVRPISPTPSSLSLSKISPILLLVIILLTAIFFISGLVHLLLRFLMKRPSSPIFQSSGYPENSSSHVLQRQLRQLFRLHDSGLDQAIIDALPVFYYKEIMGSKEPFDCAVCLCEFSDQDELRLLPPCGHAFHIHCIDTWLLSNSTCPLCRRTLFRSDLFMENPMWNFDDSFEMSNGLRSDNGENRHSSNQESISGKRVFSVRLGKYRSAGVGETSGSSSCNLDARRCYSMGTFQYVVGDSNLQVVKLVKEGVHRGKFSINGDLEGKKISSRQKGDSFSVSKIWLWSKNSRFPSCSDTDISMPTSLNVKERKSLASLEWRAWAM